MKNLKEIEKWLNDENSGPVVCSVTGQSFKNRKEMTNWRKKVIKNINKKRTN